METKPFMFATSMTQHYSLVKIDILLDSSEHSLFDGHIWPMYLKHKNKVRMIHTYLLCTLDESCLIATAACYGTLDDQRNRE